MTSSRRNGAALAAVITAAFILTGCGSDSDEPAAPAGQTRIVKAGNGSVEIPAAPKRVVTLGNTSQPFIDIGGKPVGATEISASALALLPEAQQATFKAATGLGADTGEVDLEKLAGLKPDLILIQVPDAEFKAIEQQLKTIAPTLFWGLDTEWKAFADALAEAGNLTDAVSKQKAQFTDKVTKIKGTYSKLIAETSFVAVDRWDSSDPGTFVVTDIGCVEIAADDLGLKTPKRAAGGDPLAWTDLPFEKIADLSKYDVVLYPVDAAKQPKKAFAPVVETNTWKALPVVTSGRALGVFCPGNNSYGPVLQYLDSLDSALASLPAKA